MLTWCWSARVGFGRLICWLPTLPSRPLVSADYTNDTRSGIVDGPSTMVVDDRMIKVLVWYDNEYGYAHRMVDLAGLVADRRDLG